MTGNIDKVREAIVDILYRFDDGQCPLADCPNGVASIQLPVVCQACWADAILALPNILIKAESGKVVQ